MTDLYDQRVRDMKAREFPEPDPRLAAAKGTASRKRQNDRRNIDRLAAYKRKRAPH